jgi:predicted ATPase
MWRERLTSELGNLRAALDWFVARGDADAALSLASGMAWLWFINSDVVEGARWLGDALSARGRAVLNWPRPPRSGTAISCAWRSAQPLPFRM